MTNTETSTVGRNPFFLTSIVEAVDLFFAARSKGTPLYSIQAFVAQKTGFSPNAISRALDLAIALDLVAVSYDHAYPSNSDYVPERGHAAYLRSPRFMMINWYFSR